MGRPATFVQFLGLRITITGPEWFRWVVALSIVGIYWLLLLSIIVAIITTVVHFTLKFW